MGQGYFAIFHDEISNFNDLLTLASLAQLIRQLLGTIIQRLCCEKERKLNMKMI